MKIKNQKSKIHFIGIGGIGVSGLANVYHLKGYKVQGSDSVQSEITDKLQQDGVGIFIGHKEENITANIDLVVYSEAIPEDNVELKKAKELDIECLSGAEQLGRLSEEYFTIAVSGMHGKTTTAYMIAHILTTAGYDPTYIVGTKDGSRLGKSKYLVIEADDYKAKLLNYTPDILVLTNIEEEHMDYFRDFHHILDVFREYVGKVKQTVIANADDENIKKVIDRAKCDIKYFEPENIELNVPGVHNQYNAAAAVLTATTVGIEEEVAINALKIFKGAWRRFEESDVKVKDKQFKAISDYGHHPTEINATLQATREKYSKKDIWCIFQPHQYQRTFYLFNDFVKAFQNNPVNKLIVIDIYDVEGRENKEIREKVNSQKLVEKIEEDWARYISKDDVLEYLQGNLNGGEVLLFMGAGPDVYDLWREFIHR